MRDRALSRRQAYATVLALISVSVPFLAGPVLVGVSIFVSDTAAACTVTPMSFEETTSGADIVVLGTIVEKPLTVQSAQAGAHVTPNLVKVDEYLKGDGPERITVFTPGGTYLIKTDLGEEKVSSVVSGAPQLPAEGSQVLLFLKEWGDRASFLVYSATQGVLAVESSPDGPCVNLLMRRPELMPRNVRERYEELASEGHGGSVTMMSASIPVGEIHGLVERVVQGRRSPGQKTRRLPGR